MRTNLLLVPAFGLVRSSEEDVFGKDVRESPVYGGAHVIELGDKGMLQPVDDHLGCEHEQHGLNCQQSKILLPTDKIRSTRLLPRTKLLGRKAKSEPAISIMFLSEITTSIKPSWNRSTISDY